MTTDRQSPNLRGSYLPLHKSRYFECLD